MRPTWNPLTPGCTDQPLRWRKPRRVQVADIFHPVFPDRLLTEALEVMAAAKRHTFHVATEHPHRMRSLLQRWTEHQGKGCSCPPEQGGCSAPVDVLHGTWPPPNVWLGVVVTDQDTADDRIPPLLDTPAALRWVRAAPLYGPVDLSMCDWAPPIRKGWAGVHYPLSGTWVPAVGDYVEEYEGRIAELPRIDWVVAGSEPGRGAWPVHPDWVRCLRDQCKRYEVPFHFVGWGGYVAVRVEDDPNYACGRAFTVPSGGRYAAVYRAPGPSGTFRDAVTRPMEPGYAYGRGRFVMIDKDTVAVRVGRDAGRELDGRTWEEYPQPRTDDT